MSFSAQLTRDAFCFVPAAQMRAALEAVGSLSDWDAFAATWEDLELDAYMADGGRYRRRRHAVFTSEQGAPLVRAPHQPHFQTLDYNPLNGGVERWFEPILPTAGDSLSLRTVLAFCRGLFEPLTPAAARWKIEVHQFRIEARADAEGQPTPEGVHRDGVDHVLVLLIGRKNIERGTTTIYDAHRNERGSFTLTNPLDAALVEDTRAFHGVTAVRAVDSAQPATRDVLVVTWKEALQLPSSTTVME